jgi:hypothetical protein
MAATREGEVNPGSATAICGRRNNKVLTQAPSARLSGIRRRLIGSTPFSLSTGAFDSFAPDRPTHRIYRDTR